VRVAAAYGAPVTVYPNMGHTFQSEAQQDQVCDDIVAWFAELTADPHRTRHSRATNPAGPVEGQADAPSAGALCIVGAGNEIPV